MKDALDSDKLPPALLANFRLGEKVSRGQTLFYWSDAVGKA
jgi:hypothetical protein